MSSTPGARLRAPALAEVGMLVGGIVVLGVSAWVPIERAPPGVGRVVAYGAIALAVLAPLVALLIVARMGELPSDPMRLSEADWRRLQALRLLSAALLEGAVVVCAVAALLSGERGPLYAAALPLATLLLRVARSA